MGVLAPGTDEYRRWLLRDPNAEPEQYGPEWRGERRVLLHRRDGLWSPSEGDGVLCLLLPVYSGDALIDVLAWERSRPKKVHRQYGVVTHLGARDLAYVGWDAKPTITLADSPATWLLTPPPCCCIVDWTADLCQIFRRVEVIECATPSLETFLRRRLDEQVRHRFRITTTRKR
jgi:hypothetical protein